MTYSFGALVHALLVFFGLADALRVALVFGGAVERRGAVDAVKPGVAAVVMLVELWFFYRILAGMAPS